MYGSCSFCKLPADEGGCNIIVGRDGKFIRFGVFLCLDCCDRKDWIEPLNDGEYTIAEYTRLFGEHRKQKGEKNGTDNKAL